MASDDHDPVLRWIGAMRLLEGLLVLVVAIGCLRLLHHDVAAVAARWVAAVRIDPDNKFIHWLLANSEILDDQRLNQISAGSFFYSVLKLTEGAGLLYGRRWAEYLTVIATGVFIPFELYELIHRVTLPRALVFAANLAVVLYLAIHLSRTEPRGQER